jgi:hypothetical protein
VPRTEDSLIFRTVDDDAPVSLAIAFKNAITTGDVERVRDLLKHGADVHFPYDLGLTGLHFAAWCGHAQIAKALIDAGADVQALTHGERLTARAMAEHEGHYQVIDVILDASDNSRGLVTLNIYDVGCLGVNKAFTALGTGALHVAIQVHGREWSYECSRLSDATKRIRISEQDDSTTEGTRPSGMSASSASTSSSSKASSQTSSVEDDNGHVSRKCTPDSEGITGLPDSPSSLDSDEYRGGIGAKADAHETGVFVCHPRQCLAHAFRESIRLGETSMSEKTVNEIIEQMKPKWQADQYDLLSRNCSNFCDELSRRLGAGPLPSWVMALAAAGAHLNFGVEEVASARQRTAIITLARSGEVDERFKRWTPIVMPPANLKEVNEVTSLRSALISSTPRAGRDTDVSNSDSSRFPSSKLSESVGSCRLSWSSTQSFST